MSTALMFMPINPKTGKPAPYTLEEFHDQLTRYGIEVPELEEGSQYYPFELPTPGGDYVEEEVMVMVSDERVLAVQIDEPNTQTRSFWLQLLQMGYILRIDASNNWFVNASWASEYQTSGAKNPSITSVTVVKTIADF